MKERCNTKLSKLEKALELINANNFWAKINKV